MGDFNPVTLFFILREGMGIWLWLLMALAAVLLAGIVIGFARLRRAGQPAKRPLLMALAVGLATAVLFTFLVPMWSLSSPAALGAFVDYLFAFLIALVPGGIAGAAVFFLAALRCAGRAKPA